MITPTGSWASSRVLRLAAAAVLASLAACGSDGDPDTAYSGSGSASVAVPDERVQVTRGALELAGGRVAYEAAAGHFTARSPSGVPEASFFYVAYTADGAPTATRPVTFLFNGGPGSASVWLHLGSWAPRRLSTGVPATSQATPFPYVDNTESLIDTTDLVFVDAVGTGLSVAVAPNTNASFWGVDADAAVMRDFVQGWLAANGRSASPLFVYGESYGTVRASVVARLLETAGQPVAGVVLQSSILDYASNCSVNTDRGGVPLVSCAGALPTYAAVGAYFDLTRPAPADPQSFLAAARAYADTTYDAQAKAWIAAGRGAPPAGADVAALVAQTGLEADSWNQRFDMDYELFRHRLVPGTTLGVYDGRMHAAPGSPLDADDDPSMTFVERPFTQAIRSILPDTLGYAPAADYLVANDAAIRRWDFEHARSRLPDVVPDLAAAIALDPALRVLSIGGVHDLITPFHQTELDLGRLPDASPVTSAFYDGGHMTYLDDRSRPELKATLAAFYAAALEVRR